MKDLQPAATTGTALHSEAIPHRPEADSFDVRRAWQTLVMAVASHKRLIAVVTALTMLLVLGYIMIWPPVYSAGVTLTAGSDDDHSRETF